MQYMLYVCMFVGDILLDPVFVQGTECLEKTWSNE